MLCKRIHIVKKREIRNNNEVCFCTTVRPAKSHNPSHGALVTEESHLAVWTLSRQRLRLCASLPGQFNATYPLPQKHSYRNEWEVCYLQLLER